MINFFLVYCDVHPSKTDYCKIKKLGGTWFHKLVLYLLVEELVFDFPKKQCINKSKQVASVENI